MREVDGGLAAQRRHHAFRLFKVDDSHDVFRRQRLKIQLVRGGVVGGHRFGIVVDDNGLIAGFFYGLHRVHRGIIELHPLTDANRAGTQHDDFLLVGQARHILAGVGRIQIRDIRAGVQRVHHAEHRGDAIFFTQGVHVGFFHIPQFGNKRIAEPAPFGSVQNANVARVFAQKILHLHDAL